MGRGFVDHLIGLGLADATIRNYRAKVDAAARWLTEHRHVDLATATASDIRAFATTTPNTASTRRQLRVALGHWWAWQGRDDPPVGAVRVPPKRRGVCRALEPDEARAVVKVALGWRPKGLAVLCGLYLALRASEIAALRWDQFDRDLEWVTVTGKGDVTADLPVHPILAAELEDAQTAWRWLFPGSRGRAHVHPATIWNWTTEVCRAAGVGHVEPHRLRHTALATANDRLGDLRAVAAFARHARVETTQLYTRTSARQLRAVASALDYLGDVDV